MGYGEERAVLGHEGKMEAYRRALKEAVREYARPRMRNKPMRLEGELLLIDTPSVSIVAGRYAAKMRCKISLREDEFLREPLKGASTRDFRNSPGQISGRKTPKEEPG